MIQETSMQEEMGVERLAARRKFLQQTAGAMALGMGMAAAGARAEATEQVVPHSSGTAQPRTRAPANACDAHFHIIDGRFPTVPGAKVLPHATLDDYLLLQKRIGTTRAVIVQPKVHGTDHSCLLDAIRRLGKNACGVGVLRPDVSDAQLRMLDQGGIRGLRFSVWNPADTVTTIDMIEPLARRIAPLGWHVQLHMSGDQIVEQAALLRRLPCPIVFDHMGRLPPSVGFSHPAVGLIQSLMERGNVWMKVCGAYLNTDVGAPTYSDALAVSRKWIAAAPERIVWGSDWPHVTEIQHKPDDAALFDLLAEAAGDQAALNRILVENPEHLYGFSPS
jgi:D-galactarolactone isomerase